MTDFKKSERGFAIGEIQTDLSETTYHIQESSLATEPAVRLYIHEAPRLSNNDSLHLSVPQARALAQGLIDLCDNHYQLKE